MDTPRLTLTCAPIVLGSGLLAISRPRMSLSEDRRIASLAGWLLTVTAGAAGIVSFVIVGAQIHNTLANGLTLALESRINSITINIALRSDRADLIGSSPDVLRQLRRLAFRPRNSAARAVMQAQIERLLPLGLTAISVSLPDGVEVARRHFCKCVSGEVPACRRREKPVLA